MIKKPGKTLEKYQTEVSLDITSMARTSKIEQNLPHNKDQKKKTIKQST